MTQRFCDHCTAPALPEDVLRNLTQDGVTCELPATDSRLIARLKIEHNFGGSARPDLCRTHLLAIIDALRNEVLSLTGADPTVV